jgi:hypothetical protein
LGRRCRVEDGERQQRWTGGQGAGDRGGDAAAAAWMREKKRRGDDWGRTEEKKKRWHAWGADARAER